MIKGKQNNKDGRTYHFYYLYNCHFFLNNKYKWGIKVYGEKECNQFSLWNCKNLETVRLSRVYIQILAFATSPVTCPTQRLPKMGFLASLSPGHYLPEIACHFDIMPGVVVELPIHGLDNSLKGPGAQVNDQGDRAILQS